MTPPCAPPTLRSVLVSLVADSPSRWIREWNWKTALTSSWVRSGIFLAVNASAGWGAAQAAWLTEFVFRLATSGFYGSLTARFRLVEPRWAATACAAILLPVVSHAGEFLVHWARGTAELWTSLAVSALFTVFSTTFNLHVMRAGALTVGAGSRSLADDLRAMPGLLLDFIGAGGPRAGAWLRRPVRSS